MATTAVKAVAAAASRRTAVNCIASSSRLFSSTSTTSNLAAQEVAEPSESSVPLKQAATTDKYVPVVFPNPPPHRRPFGIHVATLLLSAHHPYNLDLYTQFAYHSAHSLGIPTARPAFLPKSKELITVLKSPFIYKKRQENFERRHHRRAIEVYDANRETIDLWLRYLKKNGIAGVGMRAKVHEFVDVGFGSKEIEGLEAQLEDMKNPEKSVMAAAQKLIEELSKTDPPPPPPTARGRKGKSATTKIRATESSAPPPVQEIKAEEVDDGKAAAEMTEKVESDVALGAVEIPESTTSLSASDSVASEQQKPVEKTEKPKKLRKAKAKEVDAAAEQGPSDGSTTEPTPVKKPRAPRKKTVKATQEGETVEERSRGETEASTSESVPVEANKE